jgi:glycosyltransferase involved in cell wall biosynthesis
MGGTEVYAHTLATALMERHGLQVAVLTRDADPSRPEYETRRAKSDGMDTLWVNNTFRAVRSFEEGYRNPTIRALGASFIDEVRPDVAHVHHLTCLSTDLVHELDKRAIPIVFTLHDFWLICHRGQLLDLDYRRCTGPYRSGCKRCIHRESVTPSPDSGPDRCLEVAARRLPPRAAHRVGRALEWTGEVLRGGPPERRASRDRLRHMREVASKVQRFRAPSRTMYDHFRAFGVPAHRIAQHEYGIDLTPFRHLQRTTGDRLRIGFLGSLMVSKGAHVLLEAFAGLPRDAASLHIYGEPVGYHGDDSYRPRIEAMLSAPGVHRMGGVPHDRIPAALASLDVLVAPSIWLENSPLVIREAFAAGVPVITSRMGGMAELVSHDRNGLLFTPGDPGDLRGQLLRVLREPGLLTRLRKGIPAVRSVESDADETCALYQSLIGANAGGSRTRGRHGIAVPTSA